MLPVLVIFIPFVFISMASFLYRKFFQSEVDISGKIIMVTGASSGLGEACAKRYAKSGAKVILCSRNVEELKRVKKDINKEEVSEWPLIYCLDVTKHEDVQKTVEEVEAKYGGIDIVLSNAGISQRGSVLDSIIDIHNSLMKLNYFAQVNLVKAVLPSMLKRKSGQIISIGSVQGQIAIPFRSAYSASKHASQAFFDSLRAEVARDNISVTVVNPGYIRTNISKNALSNDGSKHGVMDKTTASGLSPSFVANMIFDATVYPCNEWNIGDMKATFAMYVRTLFPDLYFKIMEWKANSEWKNYKKSS